MMYFYHSNNRENKIQRQKVLLRLFHIEYKLGE